MEQSDYIHIPNGCGWQTLSGSIKIENTTGQDIWVTVLAKGSFDEPSKLVGNKN